MHVSPNHNSPFLGPSHNWKTLFDSKFLHLFLSPFQILCLVSSIDVNAARRPLADHPASIESAEDTPIRLPRKFREDSRTRRLHIENQTGFDGKVEKIHINSEEDHPRIRPYGIPAKILAKSGRIDRMLQKESEEEVKSGSRIARAVCRNRKCVFVTFLIISCCESYCVLVIIDLLIATIFNSFRFWVVLMLLKLEYSELRIILRSRNLQSFRCRWIFNNTFQSQ